jgi:hypothetical protein
MADVDNSSWDASRAWANGAASDDPAAFYNGICAGKKEGDPATQDAHALPHHYHPGDAPNAAGVRNAVSRLPQTDGLTNGDTAQSHLESHLKTVQAAEEKSSSDMTITRDVVESTEEASPSAPALVRSERDIRKARRQAAERHEAPQGGRMAAFPAQLRSSLVERDGKQFYEVDGYATLFNRGYDMWDFLGPYTEEVADTALDTSLLASPDVAFLVNHKGVTMARTTNGSLTLNKDALGLRINARLNPARQDVRDIVSAMDDKLVDQMSFAFMLNDGEWSDDYSTFRITEADINRGDVSAVNYGANPYTSIAARSAEIMDSLNHLPEPMARAAMERLAARVGTPETSAGQDSADATKHRGVLASVRFLLEGE